MRAFSINAHFGGVFVHLWLRYALPNPNLAPSLGVVQLFLAFLNKTFTVPGVTTLASLGVDSPSANIGLLSQNFL